MRHGCWSISARPSIGSTRALSIPCASCFWHTRKSQKLISSLLCASRAILAVDERAAIEALPRLLPADATARRAFSDLLQETVAATGKLNADAQRRLSKVLD